MVEAFTSKLPGVIWQCTPGPKREGKLLQDNGDADPTRAHQREREPEGGEPFVLSLSFKMPDNRPGWYG